MMYSLHAHKHTSTQAIPMLQGSNVNKYNSVFKSVGANDRLQNDKDMVL